MLLISRLIAGAFLLYLGCYLFSSLWHALCFSLASRMDNGRPYSKRMNTKIEICWNKEILSSMRMDVIFYRPHDSSIWYVVHCMISIHNDDDLIHSAALTHSFIVLLIVVLMKG